MNTSTRFLTGSLATLAVASTVTLAAPVAYAADEPARPCGLPAVPAAYVTVTHDPQLRVVPAVTHDEWRWQRELTAYEYEFAKVLAPAYAESDWTREVPGTTEHRWSLKVVDRAAVPGTTEQGHTETVVVTPAVTVTLFEYVQHKTGRTRWAEDGWNADDDPDQGWSKSGATREEVVTPAVTEVRWVVDQEAVPAVDETSHLEYVWAATSPGAEWTGPLATRTVGGGTESATTTGGDVPAGDGWTEVLTRLIPAVVDTVWAPSAPDGYSPTGAEPHVQVTYEGSGGTSPIAPEGDGWSQVAGSRVVVVDQEETTELIGNGYTEQVLVSPAIPASQPCVDVSAAEDDKPTGSVSGPSTDSAQASGSAAAGAAATTVLPATGGPVSPLLLSAGLGALFAGGVLVRTGRRRHTD